MPRCSRWHRCTHCTGTDRTFRGTQSRLDLPRFGAGSGIRDENQGAFSSRFQDIQEVSGHPSYVSTGESFDQGSLDKVSELFRYHPDLLREFTYFFLTLFRTKRRFVWIVLRRKLKNDAPRNAKKRMRT